MIIICFVLCAVTVSCSGSGDSGLIDFIQNSQDIDYSGYNFVFSEKVAADDTVDTKYLFYDINTEFSDAAKKRMDEVADKYNITITPMVGDFCDKLPTSYASGIVIADAAIATNFDVNKGIVASRLLYPINKMSVINYRDSEKWGEKNLLEAMAYDGNLYGVLPYKWPEWLLRTADFVIVVNEDLISSLGETDPREYVEDGTWTRNKLIEVTNAYARSSTDGSAVYGLTFFKPHIYDIALRTSGVEYAVKDDGGEWVSGLHTELAAETFKWANDFIYSKCADSILNLTTYDCASAFINNEAVMIMTHTYVALNTASDTSIAFNVENFGLLPFPLGDNMTYGEWVGQYESIPYVVFPANIEYPELSETVINAIFEPLEGYETSEALKSYYNRYIFHDPRDAEIVYKLTENARYNFYAEGGRDIVDEFGNSESELSVTEVLERYKDRYTSTMNEKIVSTYQSVEDLWG